jgi:hypothetical protein
MNHRCELADKDPVGLAFQRVLDDCRSDPPVYAKRGEAPAWLIWPALAVGRLLKGRSSSQ